MVDINVDLSGISTSLMIVSSVCLNIPSALHVADPSASPAGPSGHILALSQMTSIILLGVYVMYLHFRTWGYSRLFDSDEKREAKADKLGPLASSTIFILAGTGIAVCSNYLVDSVDGFVEAIGIGRAFIGLIILPMLGNAGEFVAALQRARTNQINFAVEVILA